VAVCRKKRTHHLFMKLDMSSIREDFRVETAHKLASSPTRFPFLNIAFESTSFDELKAEHNERTLNYAIR